MYSVPGHNVPKATYSSQILKHYIDTRVSKKMIKLRELFIKALLTERFKNTLLKCIVGKRMWLESEACRTEIYMNI